MKAQKVVQFLVCRHILTHGIFAIPMHFGAARLMCRGDHNKSQQDFVLCANALTWLYSAKPSLILLQH